MDNFYDDHRWHWWHWLILVLAILAGLGLAYTWINNYDIVKKDNQSYVNGIETTIEHPINTTENAVNDIVK